MSAAAACAGVGVAQEPQFQTTPYLRSGAPVELLPEHKPLSMPISAFYPHNRRLSPTLRVFVDWAVDLFDDNALLHGRADAAP